MTRLAIPLVLSLAALSTSETIAGPAPQSQELYVLARFNRIWRIDGFDTNSPSPVQVTEWGANQAPGFCNCEPLGLAVDQATGDFFVLGGRWFSSGPGTLMTVDRATGATSILMSLPFGNLAGLEQRWDGTLVSIDSGTTLVTIDPVALTFDERPLSGTVDGISAFSAIELDARGDVEVLTDASTRIDGATGGVGPGLGYTATFPDFGGFAIANDGTAYAGSLFPGNLYRYDTGAGAWNQIFDDGFSTLNNVYDFDLTNAREGDGFSEVCEGAVNSTGEPATMELYGAAEVASGDLQLVVRGLPTNTVGMYLMGDAPGTVSVGSGTLCIAPTVYRYGASFSQVGADYVFDADLTALPNGQAAMPGTTQIFQFWYRDAVGGTATSNLSQALSVTFE